MPGRDNNDTSESCGDIPHAIAHYPILKRLGKGGMGEVFLGEDTQQHGRKVALKVLPPELTKDESRLRRFKQEIYRTIGAFPVARSNQEAQRATAQRTASVHLSSDD